MPYLVQAAAREQLQRYPDSREAHGLDEGYAVIRRDIHVGIDAADAARVVDPVAGYRSTRPEALIAGGRQEVEEALRQLGAIGYDEVLIRHAAEDQGEVLSSFERLAAVVEALRA